MAVVWASGDDAAGDDKAGDDKAGDAGGVMVDAIGVPPDWALNEECLKYDECERLGSFIAAGKAVFHVEYGTQAAAQTVCPKTKPLGFSTLIKKLDLDAWRVACP